MIAAILAVLVVFGLLMISEYLWRIRKIRSEFTRKFVHITVGTFVAFWPFFLSWHYIELLSVAFLVVVSFSRLLYIFHSIHRVPRKTHGEVLFAIGVGATALITHEPWVFMVAILHLSLADGLAAVVGTHYQRPGKYKVLNHTKSVLGTLTFWLVSVLILSVYVLLHGPRDLWPVIIWLPPLAALIENIGIGGSDNLLVPVVVAVVLRLVS